MSCCLSPFCTTIRASFRSLDKFSDGRSAFDEILSHHEGREGHEDRTAKRASNLKILFFLRARRVLRGQNSYFWLRLRRATALGRSRTVALSSLEMRRKSYRPGEASRNRDSSIPSSRLNRTRRTAQNFAPDHEGHVRDAVRRACSSRAFDKRDVRNGYSGSPRFCRFSRWQDTREI